MAHVEEQILRGLIPTNLELHGVDSGDTTGTMTFDYLVVRHARTREVLKRFTYDEFRDINYDDEGWFDAQGPYEPQG